MSTRLYWNIKIPDYRNWAASWSGNTWNLWGGFCYYGQMMDTVKGGDATKTDYATFSVGASYSSLLYRGISRKLLPQTISGTFDSVFFARQGADTHNCYTKMSVYIIDITGSPYTPPAFAHLLTNYEEIPANGGTEWPTHPSASTFSSRKLKTPFNLSSVTIPNDGRNYRLVVEWGCISINSSGPTGDIGTRAGARSSYDWTFLPDLIVPAASQDFVPYSEFSMDIQFAAAAYPTPNHDTEFAIDVGSLPASYSVTSTDLGNTTDIVTDRWYKCTENDASTTLSILSCFPGDPSVTGYNNLYTYTSKTPVDGPPFRVGTSNGTKRPIQISMLKDGSVYWRLYLGTNVTTTVSVVKAPLDIQPGDIFINSDSGSPGLGDPTIPSGMPSTWYHPNGTLSAEIEGVVYAELGAMLGNGKFAIPSGHELFIYSAAPTVTLLHRVDLGTSSGFPSCGSDMKNFYVLTYVSSGTTKLIKISETGVISSKFWLLGDVGDYLKNLGVSRDGKILYVVGYISPPSYDDVIYRHDLIADVPLTSFPPPDSTAEPSDMLVMSDGTIVTVWNTSPSDILYHYAANGTVLHTWTLIPSYYVDHISYHGSDDPDKVWIWFQGSNPRFKFRLMNIVTGATISEFSSNWSSANQGAYDPGCNPVDRFGPGGSCTFLTMMIPANPSGIYQVRRGKTADTIYTAISPVKTEDVKIPDPFIKTSLLGS